MYLASLIFVRHLYMGGRGLKSSHGFITTKRRGVCLRRYGVDCGNRSPYTIGALATSRLEGLDLQSQPFAECSRDEAANAVRLPAGGTH